MFICAFPLPGDLEALKSEGGCGDFLSVVGLFVFMFGFFPPLSLFLFCFVLFLCFLFKIVAVEFFVGFFLFVLVQ